MLPRSNLVIDVAELLRAPGTLRHLAFEQPVEGLASDLARVDAADPLHFDLTLEVVEDGILVRGPVHGVTRVTCRRCLEQARSEFAFEAAEVYRPARDVWEEGYVVADEKIDLDLLVRDNVLINLPLYPLCREDCRGLCPVCGANLNESDCGCEPDGTDVRWSPLRDLLKDA